MALKKLKYKGDTTLQALSRTISQPLFGASSKQTQADPISTTSQPSSAASTTPARDWPQPGLLAADPEPAKHTASELEERAVWAAERGGYYPLKE